MRLIRRCAELAGRAAPDVGTIGTAPRNEPEAAPLAGTTRKLSAVLDQSLEAEFRAMPEGDVRALFQRYDEENRGRPLPHEEPSGDQLQALKEVLQVDRAPYADFAVRGAYDRRQAKIMRFTPMIFVGGSLQPKQLPGPQNLHAWRRCWRVFGSAMIALRGCKPGPLGEYEENIRSLSDVFERVVRHLLTGPQKVRGDPRPLRRAAGRYPGRMRAAFAGRHGQRLDGGHRGACRVGGSRARCRRLHGGEPLQLRPHRKERRAPTPRPRPRYLPTAAAAEYADGLVGESSLHRGVEALDRGRVSRHKLCGLDPE